MKVFDIKMQQGRALYSQLGRGGGVGMALLGWCLMLNRHKEGLGLPCGCGEWV